MRFKVEKEISNTHVKAAKSLRSFNFLSVDDFPVNRRLLTTGLVSDRTLLLNDDIDVEVSKVGKTTFSVHFLGAQRERPLDPIIIASPHWYTKSKSSFPTGVGQVSIAVVQSREWDNGFHIALGSSSSSKKQYIGFNFLAIDANLDHKNIKVGHVARNKVKITTVSKGSVCEGHDYSESQCHSIGFNDNCCYWNGKSCLARDNGQCQIGNKSFDIDWIPVESPSKIKSIEYCDILFNGCEKDNDVSVTADFEMARVTFSEAFDAIPTVILTPVLSDFNECRSLEEGFGSGNGNFREDLSIPHCIVDTIEKHSFAAKCGCLTSKSGKSRFEYKNIPFNFIATGPADDEKAFQAKKWRLVSETSLEEWDMSRLQMFSHSKVLEPKHVFASDHINGTFPCNVVNDESFWKGAESGEGIIYIGFEFKNKEKVTKVMFKNFSNSHHPEDVRLEALIDSNWQEVDITKDIYPTDNAWSSMVVLPRPLDIYTSPTLSPTDFPSVSPSTAAPSPTPVNTPPNPTNTIMLVDIGNEENSGENSTVYFRIRTAENKAIEKEWILLNGADFPKSQQIQQVIDESKLPDMSKAEYIEFKVEDENTNVFVEDVVLQNGFQQVVAVFNKNLTLSEEYPNNPNTTHVVSPAIFTALFNSRLVSYRGEVKTCGDGTDADILMTVYGRLRLADGSFELKDFTHRFHGDTTGKGENLSLNDGDIESLNPGYKENIGDIYKVTLKNEGGGDAWIFGRDPEWEVGYIQLNGIRFNFNCESIDKNEEKSKEIW